MKKTIKIAALALLFSVAAFSCKKNVSDAELTTQSTTVVAAYPGTSVEVKEGQEVSQGDVLIIAEAMKMETTIQAPKAGVIKAIHVEVGDAISVGDLLIEYEN